MLLEKLFSRRLNSIRFDICFDSVFDSSPLEDFGENLVGLYRLGGTVASHFFHYALDIVMGNSLSHNSNVRQQMFDAFHGISVVGCRHSATLIDHFLLETGRDFLLVAVL